MFHFQIMFKNKNEEEEEEEEPNASYNRKFYGDANKYDEDYYNNYIKQYQAAQNMRCHKTYMNSNLCAKLFRKAWERAKWCRGGGGGDLHGGGDGGHHQLRLGGGGGGGGGDRH